MNQDSIPRGEGIGAAARRWGLVMKNVGLRAFALIVVLVSTAAFPVRAQEFPHWESFGGFSYANVGLGPQANLFGPVSKNYFGIHLGVNFNPYRNFSVVLMDLGIQSRGSRVPRLFRNSNNNVVTSQALFGPEFKIRSRKGDGFAHALVGVTNSRLVETDSFGSIDLVRRTNLALGFGGGLDVNLNPRVAIRILQADYVPTRLAGKWQNDFRAGIGVVFRFQYTEGR
jgi:hypothetical protein